MKEELAKILYTQEAKPVEADRIRSMVEELKGAGASKKRACTITACSRRESGYCLRTDRNKKATSKIGDIDPVIGSALAPIDCLPARLVLGLEKGNPYLKTPLHDSWIRDTKLMNHLSAFGWLAYENNVTTLSRESVQTDGLIPNARLQWIFEYSIDQRNNEQLRAWSIGPTQCNLYFSPLAGVAGVGVNSFPRTWEDLWTKYTATSAIDLLPLWDYIPEDRLLHSGDSLETVQKYLASYQTGSGIDWSNTYWTKYSEDVRQALGLAELAY